MNKTRYLALNIQKEISIKYYKVDTEETVKKLFFKEYNKYPHKIINVSECANNLTKMALLLMVIYNIKGKIENHNLKIENDKLIKDNRILNSNFNKAISDGMRNHSSICARFMREKTMA